MLFGFNSAKGVVTRVVFTWSLRFGVGVGRQKAPRVKSAPLHTVVDRQKRAGPFRFLLPLCPQTEFPYVPPPYSSFTHSPTSFY